MGKAETQLTIYLTVVYATQANTSDLWNLGNCVGSPDTPGPSPTEGPHRQNAGIGLEWEDRSRAVNV